MSMWTSSLLLLIVGVAFSSASQCTKPTIKVTNTYSTYDATVVSEIAYLAEFSLKCREEIAGLPLYAEVEGKLMPVVNVDDKFNYQVSFTKEVTSSLSSYTVNIYDEEGYSNVRKSIRNGEDYSSIVPLAQVKIPFSGLYNGPLVNGSFLALIVAIGLFYVAFTERSKLVS